MKNLLKKLSPFAPDHSGAVSVLFELGGLIVVCDAGGCTGNICGFDEPRWFGTKCALFSAALRDMDAILGRDEQLVRKTVAAIQSTDSLFTALVSTPVPAVIATDFRALKKMIEKRTGKPAIAISAAGTGYYDSGAEQTYLELFRTFSKEKLPSEQGKSGIIGVTPLDFGMVNAGEYVAAAFRKKGWKNPVCFGMGSSLEEIEKASSAEKNIVVAPSGISAAEFMEKKFGIPWEIDYPCLPDSVENQLQGLQGKKVFVIHQQFAANEVRRRLGENVTVGSFFRMDQRYMNPGDCSFTGEEDFQEYMESHSFEAIVGDPKFLRLLPGFKGTFVPYRHFAVSGQLEDGSLA